MTCLAILKICYISKICSWSAFYPDILNNKTHLSILQTYSKINISVHTVSSDPLWKSINKNKAWHHSIGRLNCVWPKL